MARPPLTHADDDLFFGAVDPADAVDAVLAHATFVGTTRWAKGRRLSVADASVARAAGVTSVTVARAGPGAVGEDAAATALASRLAGSSVVAAAAAHGRVNLIAAVAGLTRVDPATVDAVNAVDERITLGTLAPLTPVAAGAVVATIKIIPFAVPGRVLAAACAAVAQPLGVAPFVARRFVLIQTRLDGTSDKLLARTDAVTRARIARLGGELAGGWTECRHEAATLAAALAAIPRGATLLIAGASATADRRDVVPAAIVAAGGRIERLGMPVDPGNLLVLAELDGQPVIGLPGCARSPKRNGFDLVLERLAAGLAVTARDIAAMGSGGLLPEAERPQPRVATKAAVDMLVGAVVLAAGRSTRMGAANKLMAILGDRPVVAHTLDAIAAAGLPPPVVVVGHMADPVRAAVGAQAADIVFAPDFADGMSRSLAAGLAAAPAAWDAALIVLGDMPRVDAATLAMIAAAVRDASTVVVPVTGGRRGNPVAWGRAHWPRLLALRGDTGARALLDTVVVDEVEVGDCGIFADVDTPEALAALVGGSGGAR